MIELFKLPPEGIRLQGVIAHMQIDEDEVLRSVNWQVFVQPSDRDFFFDIRAEGIFEGACCRCLEFIDQTIKLQSQFLGSADSDLVTRGSYTIGTQDLDVIYLPEEILDEEALVREQFILQLPMQLLCKEDCQGLCPQCGKNWNKGRCQCSPEYNRAPGALAKALAEIKLDLRP